MEVERIRVTTDVLVKSKTGKPLTAPHLAMIANRTRTALWTAGFEGLEDKWEVIFDEDEKRNTHAHHHDARYGRCRPDYAASQDDLGPIDE
jgi:hypothetical protein